MKNMLNTTHRGKFLLQKFTPIELLVVIAIIAILAAMLLPALNKAKQTAMRVSCIGKFKDLNIQDLQYAAMFNDYGMPAQLTDASLGAYGPMDCILRDGTSKPNKLALKLGLRLYEPPFCPTGSGKKDKDNNQTYGAQYKGLPALNTSFHFMNYDYSPPFMPKNHDDMTYNHLQLTKIKNPSTTIHFGERTSATGTIHYLSNMQYRHNRKQTCVFYDGHIDMKAKNEITEKNVHANASGNR